LQHSSSRPAGPFVSGTRPGRAVTGRRSRTLDAVPQIRRVHVARVDGQNLVNGTLGVVEVTGIDGTLRACEVNDQLAENGWG
jgi:hypothetical protein